MDRGTWRATVHGVAKSWTRLNDWGLTPTYTLVFSPSEADLISEVLSWLFVGFLLAPGAGPGGFWNCRGTCRQEAKSRMGGKGFFISIFHGTVSPLRHCSSLSVGKMISTVITASLAWGLELFASNPQVTPLSKFLNCIFFPSQFQKKLLIIKWNMKGYRNRVVQLHRERMRHSHHFMCFSLWWCF